MNRFASSVLVVLMLAACGGGGSGGTGGGSNGGGTGTGGSNGGGSNGGGTGTGGSNGGGSNGGGANGGGTGTGGGALANVPDPGTGTQINVDWTDVEPNDTPGQATPLGVATGDIYMWVGGNNAGGSNTADYFVFKSASGPDAGQFSFDMCYSTPITGMNANLWKVSGGMQQQPAVATWMGNTSCVTDMGAPVSLLPNTVYLFGVTISGGSGTYSA
jgi:hypothetical protein